MPLVGRSLKSIDCVGHNCFMVPLTNLMHVNASYRNYFIHVDWVWIELLFGSNFVAPQAADLCERCEKAERNSFFSIETFMHEQVLTITLARSRSVLLWTGRYFGAFHYCVFLGEIATITILWRLSSLILTMEVGKTSMQQSSQSRNFKTDLWYFGLFCLCTQSIIFETCLWHTAEFWAAHT